MFRCYQRKIGVQFHPDCPDHVKRRDITGLLGALHAGRPPRLPHCDQEWITLVDERIPGWQIPLIGFISEESLKGFGRRLRAIAARILLVCGEPAQSDRPKK